MSTVRKGHIENYVANRTSSFNAKGISLNSRSDDGAYRHKLSNVKMPSRSVYAGEGEFEATYLNRHILYGFPTFPHENPLVEKDDLSPSERSSLGPGKGSFIFFDSHVEMISKNRVPEVKRCGDNFAAYSSFWEPYHPIHDDW